MPMPISEKNIPPCTIFTSKHPDARAGNTLTESGLYSSQRLQHLADGKPVFIPYAREKPPVGLLNVERL